LLKENLTLDISKYDFEYVYQRKSWFWKCPNMILSIFVKGKLDFRHVEIWVWVCSSKENLTLDMSKYVFEYVCYMEKLRKVDFRHVQIWLWICLLHGKLNIDFRHVEIWLWICLSKEKLTFDMSKYDFEYVWQRKN
jgi:hypothetical protein